MAGEPWDPAERERKYRRRKRAGLTRIISEGDSWFDYPPHTNVIDWIDATERFAIQRFEVSGDTIHNMEATSDKVAAAVVSEQPLCVLLSAGGNDVVEEAFIKQLFVEHDPDLTPRQHLDAAQWQAKLDQLSRDFLHFMDDLGEHVPIIAHGYDYMPPSKKGAKYDGFRVSGPWVLPAMLARHIDDPALQRAIVREMINDFNDLLAKMQTKYPLHFLHVDLRGAFVESDWLNEIHLKKSGFKRVAQALIAAIDNRLPAVLQARRDAGL
jgi:hypothetical protein